MKVAVAYNTYLFEIPELILNKLNYDRPVGDKIHKYCCEHWVRQHPLLIDYIEYNPSSTIRDHLNLVDIPDEGVTDYLSLTGLDGATREIFIYAKNGKIYLANPIYQIQYEHDRETDTWGWVRYRGRERA